MKRVESNHLASILIVDDKTVNILALKTLLEREDREIFEAKSGKEALTLAMNKELDLIILDVQMPDMDGFEVAQYLKSNKKTRNIPIIFASAEKTERKSMMKGFDEGAVDYLFKPLDPEMTKAKVSILLKIQLQQKQLMEKNLSLERSALLINNSADIIGVVDPNTFAIDEINLAFSTILGYDESEAKGNSLLLFLGNEDRSKIKDLSHSKRDFLSFETSIYCKNRSLKWLDWKVVLKDQKWYVNARDITDVKHVERIRNYLAAVVKQSNDAIYIYDEEGRIISWNHGAEKIYGYSEAEALKMKIWNIIPDFLHKDAEALFNTIFAGEKVQMLETKRVTKTGKFVDVLFSASIIADMGEQHRSVAITERDITLQKAADEQIRLLNSHLSKNIAQLEQTNDELETFSYSVSHDLRSPLRIVNGNAHILEEDYGDKLDDEAKSVIGKIKNNVARMNLLIEDLLTLAKIGQRGLSKNNVKMGQLVNDVISEINSSTPNNADIKIGDLPDVTGDASLLHQVWQNLISNAIKYSSKKTNPEVQIGTVSNDDGVVYFVRDNGSGFDMKYAAKLFGAFQRFHTADEFEGTGIGLAIVKRIISKHGGAIWADAKPDEGATFFFTISANDHRYPNVYDPDQNGVQN
jgi:PAS domain S-box-containing protein